jgi:NADH-quinone oxidoreductase subunit L
MLDLVWLAIAFPLLGAAINGLFGRVINSKLVSGVIGCTALGLSFATAIGVWADYNYHWTVREGAFYEVPLWQWIHVGNLRLDAELLVDPLSIVMLLFVTGVSFLIHIYSMGYMAHDEGYSRFFCYLNLFVAMMCTLVLGANAVVMFVGWEGVGLCSYLLIGFWYRDMYNANCGMKAFVVNRIGDFGMLIGIFMLFAFFGSLTFTDIFARADQVFATEMSWVPLVIALFLMVGATGKSAQLPLHIWLPDAMAGPTPVSALIHAATMVTAGVYMVARFNPIFSAHPTAGFVVAVIGCVTAFLAATIALTQNDIKKVLAYSTVSQLGYMFLACGVGAYWVAIFHVVTHAFFKACLFLCSGSVIHGMHEQQDTRVMGGLAKFMPWTYFTFLISTFAIAGIFPLAGFFSKDEILWQVAVWQSQYGWAPALLWAVALLTAFMTAFYMGRVTWKTFNGKPRWTEEFVAKHKHPHESGPAMVTPLVVLAFLAVFAGFTLFTPAWLGNNTTIKSFLAPSLEYASEGAHASSGALLASADPTHGAGHASGGALSHHEPFITLGGSVTATEIIFALLSVVIALAALFWSFNLFVSRFGATEKWKKALKPIYSFSLNKWYIDELYHIIVVIPGTAVAYASWRFFDLKIVDGIVNGVAWVLGAFGHLIRPVQTGFVRNYALYLLLGALLFMIYNLVK